MSERAEALRELGHLLRAGWPLRAALAAWHEDSRSALQPSLAACARRLALGDTVAGSLEPVVRAFGDDGPALAAIVTLHLRVGGDSAGALERCAAAIDARGRALEAARAASAGARVSGRMVAALPFLVLPSLPLARAPLLDGVGVALIVAGVGLAAAGLACIERLVPRVPDGDPAAVLAATLASVLRAGVSLHLALAALTEDPAASSPDLAPAARRVRLGASWPDALARVPDEGMAEVARTVRRAAAAGAPLASALEALAEARRSRAARDFEAAARRAPVLMVVPLVVFVLPAFLLLGLAPFLRSLQLGA